MHADILQKLRDDLTRRRELPIQVKRHLGSVHGVAVDEIGPFLQDRLSQLEEFETEQIFGPMFSPTLEDRAAYAEDLTQVTVSETDLNSWVQRLSAAGLQCPIEVPGEADFSLSLDELLVGRYVRLLRLTEAPPAEIVARVARAIPADDRPLALALLRDAAWQSEVKRAWLGDYLDAVQQHRHGFSLLKFDFLTDLVRDAPAPDTAHLLTLTENVLSEKRSNFNVGGSSKPFFSRHIEEWHGHARDQRQVSEDEVEQKQQVIAMLTDLVADLKVLEQATRS
jgi:hypothetical protein